MLLLTTLTAGAQIKPDRQWMDNKFSMFIHFGLYSKLGGVWQGQPVRQGYSEQIQAFAGIFSDWYAATALTFNPTQWNPDSVVALAKRAGMRSIVFTAKHHDGFCMYESQYTDFDIVDATPYRRDLMKELSDACRRGGMRFAVYYSLIDWHFPEAYPISSHNADPLTEEHFDYNMKQVEEIMTRYGQISELWFDMGSLTCEQSKALYDLVNRLQPSCMVSGRLGNNMADFAVLADNAYPDYEIGVPWQSAASMFDETWGYRSWQERGSVSDKVRDKLHRLLGVVSRGGNYLLNIGPDGDGAVVPFERDVLDAMGRWVHRYAEAIYGTRPGPFADKQSWGDIVCKPKALYLYLYDMPEGNSIVLKGVKGKVGSVQCLQDEEMKLRHSVRKGTLTIMLPDTFRLDTIASIVKVEFDEPFTIEPQDVPAAKTFMPQTADKVYGYASLDYYTGYKSLVGYHWDFDRRASSVEPRIYFTDNEAGRQVELSIDDKTQRLTLTPAGRSVEYADLTAVSWGKAWMHRGTGIFGNVPCEGQKHVDVTAKDGGWVMIDNYKPGKLQMKQVFPFQSDMMLVEVTASRDLLFPVKIVAGNSAYVLLNGEYVSAEFYENRPEKSERLLVLPLKHGKNQIILKVYNRFDDHTQFGIIPLDEWNVYYMDCGKYNTGVERLHRIGIKAADRHSSMVPMSLENIRIEL